MKSLDLSNNLLSWDGPQRDSMSELGVDDGFESILSRSQPSNEAVGAIAEALKHNRTLTTLDLTGNGINAAAVSVIADGLSHNTSMIDFRCNIFP
jgi:hypothetical protein